MEDDFADHNILRLNPDGDCKSSIFSNNGSGRNFVAGTEINLKKINNIYTSPFFLINSEKNEQMNTESVKKIWQNFDSIDNLLALKKIDH